MSRHAKDSGPLPRAEDLPDGFRPLSDDELEAGLLLCEQCGSPILNVQVAVMAHVTFHARMSRLDADGHLDLSDDEDADDLRNALAEFLPADGEEAEPVPEFEPHGRIFSEDGSLNP